MKMVPEIREQTRKGTGDRLGGSSCIVGVSLSAPPGIDQRLSTCLRTQVKHYRVTENGARAAISPEGIPAVFTSLCLIVASE